MSRRRILWSPNSSCRFLVAQNDIRLYEIADSDAIASFSSDQDRIITSYPASSNSSYSYSSSSGGSSNTSTITGNTNGLSSGSAGSNSNISLIAVNSDFPLMRCVAWCESEDAKGLLAIGQTNGHIGLASISLESDGTRFTGLRDLESRYDRPCNAVAWNPVYTMQLAAGLDRGRTDYSLRVWDVSSMLAAASISSATNPISSSAASSSSASASSSSIGSSGGSGSGASFIGRAAALTTGNNSSSSSSSSSRSVSGAVSSSSTSAAAAAVARAAEKPLVETCNNDAVQSLAWIKASPFCLMSGGGNKWLRIYDFRADVSGRLLTTSTKAVYGICVNPFNEYQSASFSPEGVIKLWDSRRLVDPIFSINVENKNIQELAWSPTRSGLLSASCKDSVEILLWDIKTVGSSTSALSHSLSASSNLSDANNSGSSFNTNNPNEISDTFSPVTLCKSSKLQRSGLPLSSFAWHPTVPNRLLTVSDSGSIDYSYMTESVALAWTPQGPLTWGYGKKVFKVDPNSSNPSPGEQAYLGDASFTMKARAIQGYGIDILKNLELIQNDKKLFTVWCWLNYVSNLSKKGKAQAGKIDFSFQGIKAVIGADSKLFVNSNTGSTPGSNSTTIAVNQDSQINIPVYRSPQRKLAQLICDWNFDREKDKDKEALEAAIRKLESEGDYERAAAIALFHLDIRRAIQTLNSGTQRPGADNNLTLVAMALAGYTEAKNTLWQLMCNNLRSQLKDPYMRAAFAFLAGESPEFIDVLEERGLSLADRIGFASRFLTDSQLSNFVNRLTNQVIKEGNLEGLLLTGLTLEGVELLEQYVNLTGDVQTACLIMARKKTQDPRVRQWTESYRDLLDIWQLWHERAAFDVSRRLFDDSNKPPQQVFVRCNMCNISISRSMLTVGPTRSSSGGNANPYAAGSAAIGGPPSKPKVTSCPSCRKALPRCALCLIPLGTSSNAPSASDDPDFDNKKKGGAFDVWFTWCQTCRHGGHANHMIEWFETHTICPVTGCECRCQSLDPTALIR